MFCVRNKTAPNRYRTRDTLDMSLTSNRYPEWLPKMGNLSDTLLFFSHLYIWFICLKRNHNKIDLIIYDYLGIKEFLNNSKYIYTKILLHKKKNAFHQIQNMCLLNEIKWISTASENKLICNILVKTSAWCYRNITIHWSTCLSGFRWPF